MRSQGLCDFVQVRDGNVESKRSFSYRRESGFPQRHMYQQPESVVGMLRQSHLLFDRMGRFGLTDHHGRAITGL